jgi:hypothetical protein
VTDEAAAATVLKREADRVFKAMMLAPTLEICEALLRGERVPLTKLDSEWAKRFGLRR